MTQEVTQRWHSDDADELTLRLGERFRPLCEWACAHGFGEDVEDLYLILGLSPSLVGISNIAEEFSHHESTEVLHHWQDNFYAKSLSDFSAAFSSVDPLIFREFYREHSGNSDNTKNSTPDFRVRTFLLAMIVNPLSANTDDEGLIRRRRLRLWLLVRALSLLAVNECSAERHISIAARFLIKDTRHLPDWDFVDKLLARAEFLLGGFAPSFERFTDALARSAHETVVDGERANAHKRFLAALTAIADGECEPIEEGEAIQVVKRRKRRLRLVDPPTWSIEEHESGESAESEGDEAGNYQVFPLSVQADGLVEDELEADQEAGSLSLVDVDPTASADEHRLKTRSFFIQTVEESHYLPWSWNKPLPQEREQLRVWIESGLNANESQRQLAGVLVWLATQFGRSLFFVLKFEINAELGEEWSISPDFAFVKRRSLRRQNAWLPKSDEMALQVKPYQDSLCFALPDNIVSALQAVVTHVQGSYQSLGDLWQAVAPERANKVETWFSVEASQHFPRIKSGMLAQVAGQQIIERTGDPQLARMLTAHPNSGLPGACGYAAWDIATIEKGMALTAVYDRAKSANTTNLNLLGSVLAPLETVLVDGIQQANTLLKEAANTDISTLHNRYAAYCVMALYAATGCRHLKEPFESLSHFNFDEGLVFINDKSDGGLHNGRIVPLPANAIALVQRYLEHLKALADALATSHSVLANKLRALLTPEQPSDSVMPLFFVLDSHLCWRPMTENPIPGLPLFDWLLPSNLFRHRYSQQLRKDGVPVDIIEGWMGHAERGVSAYGDYSPRCWKDDAAYFDAQVNTLFDRLGFELMEVPAPYSYLPLPIATDAPISAEPVLFGLAARQRTRRQRLKRVIAEAKIDIENFCRGRSLDQLSETALSDLGSRMLLRENGLAHQFAAIRFRVLLKQLDAFEGINKAGLRRRVVDERAERSLVSPALPSALTQLEHLDGWAKRAKKQFINARVSKLEARCLGAVLLSIEKRISYQQLLRDVVFARNIRLVQHKKRYFIEYSEVLDPADFKTPVQRHEISHKVASLIAYGTDLKHRSSVEEVTAPSLLSELTDLLIGSKGFEDTLAVSMATVLAALSHVIEQANVVQLPGMVAGALSERLPPTSMPLQDYLRLAEGVMLQPPLIDMVAAVDDAIAGVQLRPRRLVTSDAQQLQRNTKAFYSEINSLLKDYTKPGAKQSSKAVIKVCTRHEHKVSAGVLLLAYWLAHVIGKGKGRGKRFQPYAANTISRYFGALRQSFYQLVYKVDLIQLDDEQVTALYVDMLDAKRAKGEDTDYFGARLKDFHRWAAGRGVEEPDWSEITTSDDARSVNPGVLSEQDYFACQAAIREAWPQDSDERLFLGFTLLLTYRFGLRYQEALGLRRFDWCESGGHQWVLVRNNRLRELKWGVNSRRAVPLLFTLSSEEHQLIEFVLARYEAMAGEAVNRPILSELRKGKVELASVTSRISPLLIRILRQVTGNPYHVLHHCRHSFYNRLAPILLGFETPATKALIANIDTEQLLITVLGEHHTRSRRSGMALARLMGHGMPTTGLKSYCHVMTEWADALTPVKHSRAHQIGTIVNTAQFEQVPSNTESGSGAPTLALPEPRLSTVLKALRLGALGKPLVRAGELVALRPECASDLNWLVHEAGRGMRFKARSAEGGFWIKGEEYPMGLLHYINDDGWARLLEQAEAASVSLLEEEKVFPPLHEIASMLGMNRHVLMSHERHIHLVNSVLKVFNIPEEHYQVFANDDSPESSQLLTNAGFNVIPKNTGSSAGKAVQLDQFIIRAEGKLDRRIEYGALVIKRNDAGTIRSSYELAMAVIAVAVLKQHVYPNPHPPR